MACLYQSFCLFLLSIRYAWPIMAYDPLPHSDVKSAPENQYDVLIAQEYSWQRLQANKYGLPKCAGRSD